MIKTFTGTIAALMMTTLSVLGATRAEAACSPASGANTPPPGTTVTCSGSNPATYGDFTQSGLTINVQSGGSVTSATGDGFDLNSNNAINNNGTVQSAALLPFSVGNNSNALDVTNSGTISGVAAGIAANAGFLSVVNTVTGTITSSENGAATIFGGGNISIANSGTITAGALGFAIFGRADVSAVTAGTISSGAGGTTILSMADLKLTNTGSITSSGAFSIPIDAHGNAVINNSGSITNIGGHGAMHIVGRGDV